MKTTRAVLIIPAIVLMMVGAPHPARAIPNLQIYIPGAEYDMATQTWVINAYDYDLWVIGAQKDVSDVKFAAAVPTDEDGSIAVTWLTPSSSDYGQGYGSVDSLTFDESDAMPYDAYRDSYASGDPDPATYGFGTDTTPIMGDGSPVPPHGVFPTDFYEYFIGDFGTGETVYNYVPGDEAGDTAQGQTKKFHVSVTGYSWVDIIAYDHVVVGQTNAK